MIKNKKVQPKVVSFERSAEYYYLKYQRQMDKGAYLDALDSLRTAVRKEPDNCAYQLALAEFYTEINYFEESNYRVLEAMRRMPGEEGRTLFLLGCNFFGMREEQKAQECFEKYLDRYENGEYALDVRDFLEMMEFDAEEYGVPRECLARSDEGRDWLDRGEYDKAIEILGEICQEHPDLEYAKNNLALAHYCRGDVDLAIALSKEVLAYRPKDTYATCNLVLFSLALDDPEQLLYYCSKLDALAPEDPDEKIKIALTYSELNEDEKAYRVLCQALGEIPYDPQALFWAGAAAANTGRLAESLEYFLKMIKLRPEDTIALFYKNYVQDALKKGESAFIAYNYQVPIAEMHRRISYLNDCFRKNQRHLQDLWREDDYFSSLLIWGLSVGNDAIRKAVFEIICKFEDEKAEEFFRRFLLSRDEPDELKNQALLCLRRMQAEQPYIAYLSGKIAEVRVGVVEEMSSDFTGSHQRVLEEIIALASDYGWKQYMPGAIELMGKYLGAFRKASAMRSIRAWAGAFLCLAARQEQQELAADMLSRAGVEKSALHRCMRAIERKLEEQESCSCK